MSYGFLSSLTLSSTLQSSFRAIALIQTKAGLKPVNITGPLTCCPLPVYFPKELNLEKFISYNQSTSEVEHKLEQLRAIDNNIKINVGLAKSSPIGVDTEEDFIAIKKIMEYKSKWAKFIFKEPLEHIHT